MAHNVREWDAASRLLADTVEIIKKNGWQQGAVDPVPQECTATALERAFREKPEYTLVDLNYAKAILNQEIGVKEPPIEILVDAKDEPAVPYWGMEYMNWNDQKDQTMDAIVFTIMSASGKAAKLSKAG